MTLITQGGRDRDEVKVGTKLEIQLLNRNYTEICPAAPFTLYSIAPSGAGTGNEWHHHRKVTPEVLVALKSVQVQILLPVTSYVNLDNLTCQSPLF